MWSFLLVFLPNQLKRGTNIGAAPWRRAPKLSNPWCVSQQKTRVLCSPPSNEQNRATKKHAKNSKGHPNRPQPKHFLSVKNIALVEATFDLGLMEMVVSLVFWFSDVRQALGFLIGELQSRSPESRSSRAQGLVLSLLCPYDNMAVDQNRLGIPF